MVRSPYGNGYHYGDNVLSGEFSFTAAESGDYTACFSLAAPDPAETVTVEFVWKTGVAAKDWNNVAKKGQIDVKGRLGGMKVLVLVDCGASANFISKKLVNHLKLEVSEIAEFIVDVETGDKWEQLKEKRVIKGDPSLYKSQASWKAMVKTLNDKGEGFMLSYQNRSTIDMEIGFVLLKECSVFTLLVEREWEFPFSWKKNHWGGGRGIEAWEGFWETVG
ncbi:unnamed protein product [Sphenostylis stenocarpa]|uniref:GOLD domain-containing protein n=1 Tax=Sphenostylis stenocarpa TaxID=92480 RepID=A0AA86RNC3_9FABA|nr:unnamed protein product [Sphenostylis stenocarpa]